MKDSLVLVNHINVINKSHSEKHMSELVTQAALDRLRAILLTTISTVAGLMPLAYDIGGSDPYMSPMALALACGLLFATPLTLILLPSLYMIGQDVDRVFKHV